MTSASNQEIKCRRCQVSTESDMANGPPYHIRCPKCKIEVTLCEDQSVGLRYSPRLLLNEFAQFLQSAKLASGEQLEGSSHSSNSSFIGNRGADLSAMTLLNCNLQPGCDEIQRGFGDSTPTAASLCGHGTG